MLDTDDLDRKELYATCCAIYREVRKDNADLGIVLELLEEAGFCLRDIE